MKSKIWIEDRNCPFVGEGFTDQVICERTALTNPTWYRDAGYVCSCAHTRGEDKYELEEYEDV